MTIILIVTVIINKHTNDNYDYNYNYNYNCNNSNNEDSNDGRFLAAAPFERTGLLCSPWPSFCCCSFVMSFASCVLFHNMYLLRCPSRTL